MLAQALSAQVQLMHPAINHWRIRPAQVATAAYSLRLSGGRRGRAQSPSLKIKSARSHQGSKRQQTDSRPQNLRIGVLSEGRGQKSQPRHHQHTSRNNRPPTGLLAHPDTFFQLRRFLLPQRRIRLHPDHIGFLPRTPDDRSNDRVGRIFLSDAFDFDFGFQLERGSWDTALDRGNHREPQTRTTASAATASRKYSSDIRSPLSRSTFGSHPISVRALVISGRRCFGSSSGSLS